MNRTYSMPGVGEVEQTISMEDREAPKHDVVESQVVV